MPAFANASDVDTHASDAAPHGVAFTDPRSRFAQPPFENQGDIDMTGETDEMTPKPDHGESSYRGQDRLRDRVAVVTGADSGIGRAIALAYAREGADVVINYLDEHDDAEATADLVRSAGRKPLVEPADLREREAAEGLIERAVDTFGRLDLLVNNAAYQETRESVDEMEPELFDRIFKTNVYAPFWLSRAALPHMKPGSGIINTVSIQAYQPSGMLLPYASTKSALTGMTKALAKLAIERGVRVNAVAPGPVWTPLIPGSMPPEQVKKFGSSTVIGRPAQPAELAPLYVWLASAEASYVTGEVFGATGGSSPL